VQLKKIGRVLTAGLLGVRLWQGYKAGGVLGIATMGSGLLSIILVVEYIIGGGQLRRFINSLFIRVFVQRMVEETVPMVSLDNVIVHTGEGATNYVLLQRKRRRVMVKWIQVVIMDLLKRTRAKIKGQYYMRS
jgi:hypothetical protein